MRGICAKCGKTCYGFLGICSKCKRQKNRCSLCGKITDDEICEICLSGGSIKTSIKESKIQSIDHQIQRRKERIQQLNREIDELLDRRIEIEQIPEITGKVYVSERYRRQGETLKETWKTREYREKFVEGQILSGRNVKMVI